MTSTRTRTRGWSERMDDLQFERADFGAAPAAKTCTGCHQPIAGDYYDVNGQPFCPACTASHPAGARRQRRVARPSGAPSAPASAAGAVGSALYYIVERISGYQLSIIAIAVGFLVGRAVRWGTGGRGGVLYQVLAVALTYVAIAFSALPFLVAREPGLARPACDLSRPDHLPARPADPRGPRRRRSAWSSSASASTRPGSSPRRCRSRSAARSRPRRRRRAAGAAPPCRRIPTARRRDATPPPIPGVRRGAALSAVRRRRSRRRR